MDTQGLVSNKTTAMPPAYPSKFGPGYRLILTTWATVPKPWPPRKARKYRRVVVLDVTPAVPT